MVICHNTPLPLSDPTWGPDQPLCLEESFWHNVLSCFDDLFAVHVDKSFGGHHMSWILRDYWNLTIDSTTWISLVYRDLRGKSSIGLMLYLIEYEIYCDNYQECLQYAADHNKVDALYVLMHPDYLPVLHGDNLVCPTIDVVLCKGYTDVLSFIFWRVPKSMYSTLLETPTNTILHLMKHQKWDLVRKLIPVCMYISYATEIKACIQYGNTKMLKYVLKYVEPSHNLLSRELIEEAIIHNKIDMMNYLLSRMNMIIDDKMFSLAFSHGYETMVDLIMQRYGHTIPNANAVYKAVSSGYVNLIKKIDARCLPADALHWCLMIEDPNTLIDMTKYVYAKIKKKTTINHGHLDRCIDRGNSIGIILLYNLYPDLDDLLEYQKLRMIQKGMSAAIKSLHVMGQRFDTVNCAFLSACRVAQVDILKVLIDQQGYRPGYSELEEGLRLITLQTKSIEKNKCWIYVNQYFQNRRKVLSKRNFLDISDPPLQQEPAILKRPKHVTNSD